MLEQVQGGSLRPCLSGLFRMTLSWMGLAQGVPRVLRPCLSGLLRMTLSWVGSPELAPSIEAILLFLLDLCLNVSPAFLPSFLASSLPPSLPNSFLSLSLSGLVEILFTYHTIHSCDALPFIIFTQSCIHRHNQCKNFS